MVRYDPYTDSFIDNPTKETTATINLDAFPKSIVQQVVEVSDKSIEKIADAVVRKLTDCKTEPSNSEKPNNSTISKMEQVDKDINVRSKDEPQTGEMMTEEEFDSMLARVLTGNNEPQTETEIAKAIVHKMIDDAVIAEDAYPDLRQKMHDAVDEYEPQTDCAWK